MDDADAVMSDTVGRVRDKKELSVLMPKMTESEMRRVHSWQMDRVTNFDSNLASAKIIIYQSGVAQE